MTKTELYGLGVKSDGKAIEVVDITLAMELGSNSIFEMLLELQELNTR